MSKFVIECPSCHRFMEGRTGLFATRRLNCACGFVIDVQADKLTSRHCPHCGNDVVYDQTKGEKAKCPVCGKQLAALGDLVNIAKFACPTCGCSLACSPDAAKYTCPLCDTVIDVQQAVKAAEIKAGGIPSVIQYEGDNRTFVWKHPLTDFVMGSQLIVHESQEAIFFRNGEALDSFGPGRYTLETGVLPKMDSLFRLPMQGQPFHAEVYFVNLTTQMGIKWGTNSKVGLFDPISGIHVELGASGSFNLQVSDARRLVIRLVGTTDSLNRDQLFSGDTGYFRTLVMTQVKANLARIIKDNRINVLELDERVDTISHALREAINPTLADYGLTMPEFYVSNIVTPDDDPNFRRLKQQHADLYLKTREEQIRKAEAEAAFERKAVEAQTAARMKIIGAQGEAEARKIQAEAEASAYKMQAEAEAAEMRMKGYTYQQETARQVGIEAMRHEGGAGGLSGITSDMMGLGVGLGAMGSVVGMTKDALNPVIGAAANMPDPVADAWDCSCGQRGNTGKFCPGCGTKRPEPVPLDTWECPNCHAQGLRGKFCPECGAKKPEAPATWDCTCGQKGITSKFCPNCGAKREG